MRGASLFSFTALAALSALAACSGADSAASPAPVAEAQAEVLQAEPQKIQTLPTPTLEAQASEVVPRLKPALRSPPPNQPRSRAAVLGIDDMVRAELLAEAKANNPISPDTDKLNPGYMYQDSYDEVEPHNRDYVKTRYGFAGQDFTDEALYPDWVRVTNLEEVSNPNLEYSVSGPPLCWGVPRQGGLIACMIASNSGLTLNGKVYAPYQKDGVVLIGLDRDAPRKLRGTLRNGHFRETVVKLEFDIEPREYDTSRIDGLPKNMVSEYTPQELKRIRAATKRKKVGFASNIKTLGFSNGFIYPVKDHIKTTNFGAQRILNGDPKRPHFGVDLAAPKGTPIYAPADGIVSLADEDMYFEGSLVMIDHGQGLISYYLHNEEVMVEAGEVVRQGQQIATVGSKGRSTGPHLCWRLKWHGRNLDPELLTQWPKG